MDKNILIMRPRSKYRQRKGYLYPKIKVIKEHTQLAKKNINSKIYMKKFSLTSSQINTCPNNDYLSSTLAKIFLKQKIINGGKHNSL